MVLIVYFYKILRVIYLNLILFICTDCPIIITDYYFIEIICCVLM